MYATQIAIAGNLAADPELRFTPNGKATARMRVAVNERRQNTNGEWIDGQTSWHTVIAWGALAEHAAAHLAKGTRVVVTGRLAQRDYQDKDGAPRSVWEVTAEEIGTSLRHGLPAQGGASASWTDAEEPMPVEA